MAILAAAVDQGEQRFFPAIDEILESLTVLLILGQLVEGILGAQNPSL